jgi:Zn-dependent protease with chaperone function
MKAVQRRFGIPPFAVFALTTATAAVAVVAFFAIAVERGAPAHAAGVLLEACTSFAQVAGGVISIALLSLPFLLALAGVGHGVRTQWRTRQMLRRLHPRVEPDQKLLIAADASGLSGRVGVVDCDELIALTYGLARPRVLLSRGAVDALTPTELRAVLAHEATHVSRRDPLRLLVGEIASAALVVFPVVREFARHVLVATELAADRAAVATWGRRALAGGLLKFIETPRHLAVPGLALESTNDARVAALLRPGGFVHSLSLSRTAVLRTLLSASAIAVILGVLFALPPML